jgi:hypothetical protein
MVFRYDTSALVAPVRTPAGYLRVDARLTRCGVLTYKTADGKTIRELRHPDDVFEPASLDTLIGAPVTDEHPMIPALSSENAQQFQMGSVGNDVRADDEFVRSTLTITVKRLVDKVESGLADELSGGYICDVIEETGNYEGEPYDRRQKNIRYNHVAVVEKGRAGPDVRLRADSSAVLLREDEFAIAKATPYKAKGKARDMANEKKTVKQDAHVAKIGDDEYSVSHKGLADAMGDPKINKLLKAKMKPAAEAIEAPDEGKKDEGEDGPHDDPAPAPAGAPKQLGKTGKLQGFPDSSQPHPEESTKDADDGDEKEDDADEEESMDDKKDKKKDKKKDSADVRQDAEFLRLQGRADAQELELKRLKEATSPEAINAAVAERAELMRVAEQHGVRVDSSMAAIDIQREVVKALSPQIKIDGAADAYVKGAFEMSVAMIDEAPSAGFLKLKVGTVVKADAAEASPYDKMVAANLNAWKPKESKEN